MPARIAFRNLRLLAGASTMRTTGPGSIAMMGAGDWALLILLSVLWGGSFFFAEVALAEVGPFSVVFGRVAIAALALVVLVHLTRGRLPREARTWGALFVMGALNNVIPFSLIVWGQTEIAGALASILNATTPLFTVVLAHVLTRDEKLTAWRLAGVFVGLAGVAVTIGPGALSGLGLAVLAQLAVVGAAVSYAFASIFGRRFAGMPPLVTAAGQVSAASVMVLPLFLLVERPWQMAPPSGAAWAAIFGIALLSTALAYAIYFRILRSAGATNVSLVTLLIPVSAIALGAVILGEGLRPPQIAGMALIGLGLAAIDGRVLRWLQLRPASSRKSIRSRGGTLTPSWVRAAWTCPRWWVWWLKRVSRM